MSETPGPRSRELFERARQLMPGGVSSPVRAFQAVGGDHHLPTIAPTPRAHASNPPVFPKGREHFVFYHFHVSAPERGRLQRGDQGRAPDAPSPCARAEREPVDVPPRKVIEPFKILARQRLRLQPRLPQGRHPERHDALATDLVPRGIRFIQQQHGAPRLTQTLGQEETGHTGSDHNYVGGKFH